MGKPCSKKRQIWSSRPILPVEPGGDHIFWGCQQGGRWLPEETSYHINVLPRTASGLTRFNVLYEEKAKAQELLLMDNISIVTYIDKMGGGGTHSL